MSEGLKEKAKFAVSVIAVVAVITLVNRKWSIPVVGDYLPK